MSMPITSYKSSCLFFGEVSDQSTVQAMQTLCAIRQKRLQPNLIISSPGGDADPGFAFYDTVKMLRLNHSVVATAEVASIAVLLLLSAPFEKRFITKNGYLFLHKFSAENKKGKDVTVGSKGFHKLQKSSQEGLLLQQALYIDVLSMETKNPTRKIADFMEKEAYLSPKDAVRHRFVSKIV